MLMYSILAIWIGSRFICTNYDPGNSNILNRAIIQSPVGTPPPFLLSLFFFIHIMYYALQLRADCSPTHRSKYYAYYDNVVFTYWSGVCVYMLFARFPLFFLFLNCACVCMFVWRFIVVFVSFQPQRLAWSLQFFSIRRHGSHV